MWIYAQRTGRLYDPKGELAGVGYSGAGRGKNDPVIERVKDVGPIPGGMYTIGSPIDTMTHGPYVLPLTPDPDNKMYGRAGFLIHGDSVVHPGRASEGCIIMARGVREYIGGSLDRDLKVIPDWIAPEEQLTT